MRESYALPNASSSKLVLSSPVCLGGGQCRSAINQRNVASEGMNSKSDK